ncbi:MAG: YraN family protein [Aquisalinus sp.]|nr:YraN family protein [Aquisalinus sp.]
MAKRQADRPGFSRHKRQKSEQKGRFAESLAEVILRLKGYRILARRWKCSHGEVDIIARQKDTLIFVEVKARNSTQAATEAVTPQNRRRIERAASTFTQRKRLSPVPAFRFDIFAVATWRDWIHKKDAWRSGD